MDHLPDGAHVRLRSRVHATYLHADEDGVGVSLRPHGPFPSVNAVWRLQRDVFEGSPFVLLQGAAYGRYLAVSPEEAPPGHRGRRAVQRDYAGPNLNRLMWRAYAVGDDGDGYIRMRHEFNCNLRANGRHRIWHTGVTVDYNRGRFTTMMHWRVEVIPQKSAAPPLPFPTLDQGGGLLCWHTGPEADPGRTIRYVRANDEGEYTLNHNAWPSLHFLGRSIFNLRTQLRLLQPDGNVIAITLCVRPGFHGRLTPLVTDLPRSEEPMYIVIFTTGSPGENSAVFSVVCAALVYLLHMVSAWEMFTVLSINNATKPRKPTRSPPVVRRRCITTTTTGSDPRDAMDKLPDAAHVRLRSRVLATYLHADEDWVGVSLRPRGRVPSLNAVWLLHRVTIDRTTFVLLHGAAYGRYLAASPDPAAPPGHRGRRAVKRDYGGPNPRAVMWRAFAVDGGYVRLGLRHEFNSNLRANGRYCIWHTGVTVNSNGGWDSTMMHWRVEPVPLKSEPPPLPLPTPVSSPSFLLGSWKSSAHRVDSVKVLLGTQNLQGAVLDHVSNIWSLRFVHSVTAVV
ncbi:hypothetical protein BAE44_0005016 [Dichanthelium oligosanthes]|uniref:DUF569 domain-containing protein n=1 Tax=Dichanthelium oligosanthes TaxID=888268 RepID=A0A1E5W9D2_9POAL|nr:hypothetical protein BAE44_0005016 [Dichanthelium oligosanthes]